MKSKTCPVCRKEFLKKYNYSKKQWNKSVYCSKRCKGIDVGIKKGNTPWNKGKSGLQEAWNKGIPMKKETKLKISGENNYKWKGDEVGYSGVHKWLVKKYGSANHCEFSKYHENTKYEWANVSGNYLRDVGDWTQLCVKCHRDYDNLIRNSQKRDVKTGKFIPITMVGSAYYGVGNAFA